jgi:hypothetical protein
MGWGLPRSKSGLSSPGIAEEEGGMVVLLGQVDDILAKMKDWGRRGWAENGRNKGKERERDNGEEVGEGMKKLADLVKKSPDLKGIVNMDEVVQW